MNGVPAPVAACQSIRFPLYQTKKYRIGVQPWPSKCYKSVSQTLGFVCRSPVNPRFAFNSVAGRYIVLCFFGSATDSGSRRVLDDLLANRHVFDDEHACFFGVSIDPDDEAKGRVENVLPGVRFFWDFDRSVSRLYRAIPDDANQVGLIHYQRFSLVLDERLRVLAILPIGGCPTNTFRN